MPAHHRQQVAPHPDAGSFALEEAIRTATRSRAEGVCNRGTELMQAAQRSIIHKNNASRKVSRLSHQIASSPNELIEKDSRRKAATPGFLLGRALHLMLRHETMSWRSRFLSDAVLPHTDVSLKNPATCCSIDGCDHAGMLLKERSRRRAALQGLPIPLNTKKRDCLVAYSHSARDHFENAFGDTIKSKYFMTVLRAIVTNMTRLGVSILHDSSTSCFRVEIHCLLACNRIDSHSRCEQ